MTLATAICILKYSSLKLHGRIELKVFPFKLFSLLFYYQTTLTRLLLMIKLTSKYFTIVYLTISLTLNKLSKSIQSLASFSLLSIQVQVGQEIWLHLDSRGMTIQITKGKLSKIKNN